MKKILVAFAVVFAAISASAQPGGFGGGFGGGMPPMGGMGMGPGMGNFDMFSFTRADIAEAKTEELTELLGLTNSQANKVNIIYSHTDSDLTKQMNELLAEQRKQREANMTEEDKAKQEAEREEMRKRMAENMGGGMGPGGFGGFGAGMPDFSKMEEVETPKAIPISEKEKAYRAKMMKKVLKEDQYAKWLEYEAAQPEVKIEDYIDKVPDRFRR